MADTSERPRTFPEVRSPHIIDDASGARTVSGPRTEAPTSWKGALGVALPAGLAGLLLAPALGTLVSWLMVHDLSDASLPSRRFLPLVAVALLLGIAVAVKTGKREGYSVAPYVTGVAWLGAWAWIPHDGLVHIRAIYERMNVELPTGTEVLFQLGTVVERSSLLLAPLAAFPALPLLRFKREWRFKDVALVSVLAIALTASLIFGVRWPLTHISSPMYH